MRQQKLLRYPVFKRKKENHRVWAVFHTLFFWFVLFWSVLLRHFCHLRQQASAKRQQRQRGVILFALRISTLPFGCVLAFLFD